MTLPLVLTLDQAAGQTPRFRLTPLVKLDFTPNADFNSTIGINNKGQVVNITDLLAVNAAWGQGCPENFTGGDPAPSLEEIIVLALEAPIPQATQVEIIQELLSIGE